MDELIKALTDEQTHAAAAMKEAEERGEHYQGAYWEGYQDAINNAAALIYGPTPLEGEKPMNKLDKEERIAYLKIAFHGYLFRMQRGQYNDARLIADSLRYEAYEWEREEYKERNN